MTHNGDYELSYCEKHYYQPEIYKCGTCNDGVACCINCFQERHPHHSIVSLSDGNKHGSVDGSAIVNAANELIKLSKHFETGEMGGKIVSQHIDGVSFVEYNDRSIKSTDTLNTILDSLLEHRVESLNLETIDPELLSKSIEDISSLLTNQTDYTCRDIDNQCHRIDASTIKQIDDFVASVLGPASNAQGDKDHNNEENEKSCTSADEYNSIHSATLEKTENEYVLKIESMNKEIVSEENIDDCMIEESNNNKIVVEDEEQRSSNISSCEEEMLEQDKVEDQHDSKSDEGIIAFAVNQHHHGNDNCDNKINSQEDQSEVNSSNSSNIRNNDTNVEDSNARDKVNTSDHSDDLDNQVENLIQTHEDNNNNNNNSSNNSSSEDIVSEGNNNEQVQGQEVVMEEESKVMFDANSNSNSNDDIMSEEYNAQEQVNVQGAAMEATTEVIVINNEKDKENEDENCMDIDNNSEKSQNTSSLVIISPTEQVLCTHKASENDNNSSTTDNLGVAIEKSTETTRKRPLSSLSSKDSLCKEIFQFANDFLDEPNPPATVTTTVPTVMAIASVTSSATAAAINETNDNIVSIVTPTIVDTSLVVNSNNQDNVFDMVINEEDLITEKKTQFSTTTRHDTIDRKGEAVADKTTNDPIDISIDSKSEGRVDVMIDRKGDNNVDRSVSIKTEDTDEHDKANIDNNSSKMYVEEGEIVEIHKQDSSSITVGSTTDNNVVESNENKSVKVTIVHHKVTLQLPIKVTKSQSDPVTKSQSDPVLKQQQPSNTNVVDNNDDHDELYHEWAKEDGNNNYNNINTVRHVSDPPDLKLVASDAPDKPLNEWDMKYMELVILCTKYQGFMNAVTQAYQTNRALIDWAITHIFMKDSDLLPKMYTDKLQFLVNRGLFTWNLPDPDLLASLTNKSSSDPVLTNNTMLNTVGNNSNNLVNYNTAANRTLNSAGTITNNQKVDTTIANLSATKKVSYHNKSNNSNEYDNDNDNNYGGGMFDDYDPHFNTMGTDQEMMTSSSVADTMNKNAAKNTPPATTLSNNNNNNNNSGSIKNRTCNSSTQEAGPKDLDPYPYPSYTNKPSQATSNNSNNNNNNSDSNSLLLRQSKQPISQFTLNDTDDDVMDTSSDRLHPRKVGGPPISPIPPTPQSMVQRLQFNKATQNHNVNPNLQLPSELHKRSSSSSASAVSSVYSPFYPAPKRRKQKLKLTWTVYYDNLVAYGAKHGTYNVPENCKIILDDGQVLHLGSWLRQQKSDLYRKLDEQKFDFMMQLIETGRLWENETEYLKLSGGGSGGDSVISDASSNRRPTPNPQLSKQQQQQQSSKQYREWSDRELLLSNEESPNPQLFSQTRAYSESKVISAKNSFIDEEDEEYRRKFSTNLKAPATTKLTALSGTATIPMSSSRQSTNDSRYQQQYDDADERDNMRNKQSANTLSRSHKDKSNNNNDSQQQHRLIVDNNDNKKDRSYKAPSSSEQEYLSRNKGNNSNNKNNNNIGGGSRSASSGRSSSIHSSEDDEGDKIEEVELESGTVGVRGVPKRAVVDPTLMSSKSLKETYERRSTMPMPELSEPKPKQPPISTVPPTPLINKTSINNTNIYTSNDTSTINSNPPTTLIRKSNESGAGSDARSNEDVDTAIRLQNVPKRKGDNYSNYRTPSFSSQSIMNRLEQEQYFKDKNDNGSNNSYNRLNNNDSGNSWNNRSNESSSWTMKSGYGGATDRSDDNRGYNNSNNNYYNNNNNNNNNYNRNDPPLPTTSRNGPTTSPPRTHHNTNNDRDRYGASSSSATASTQPTSQLLSATPAQVPQSSSSTNKPKKNNALHVFRNLAEINKGSYIAFAYSRENDDKYYIGLGMVTKKNSKTQWEVVAMVADEPSNPFVAHFFPHHNEIIGLDETTIVHSKISFKGNKIGGRLSSDSIKEILQLLNSTKMQFENTENKR